MENVGKAGPRRRGKLEKLENYGKFNQTFGKVGKVDLRRQNILATTTYTETSFEICCIVTTEEALAHVDQPYLVYVYHLVRRPPKTRGKDMIWS